MNAGANHIYVERSGGNNGGNRGGDHRQTHDETGGERQGGDGKAPLVVEFRPRPGGVRERGFGGSGAGGGR